MATNEAELTWDKVTFKGLCRENTGAHICDSGGAYGRTFDKPPVKDYNDGVIRWDEGCSATLSTAYCLEHLFTIDRDLQREFMKFAMHEDRCDDSWGENLEEFTEMNGWTSEGHSDNSYNYESDLDQCVQIRAFDNDDEDGYDHQTIVIQVHTGCDVRGGYSRPVFCEAIGGDPTSYLSMMGAVASYRAESLDPKPDPNQLDLPISDLPAPSDDWLQEIDETWQRGYSDYPYGKLENDVEEWHEDTRTINTVEVTLKTGKRIRVRAVNDIDN